MRPRRAIVVVLAIWMGLAAGTAHAKTIQITIANLAFQPAHVSAKVGDTVEWTNNDIISHTATASNGRVERDNGTEKIGSNYSKKGRRRRLLLHVSSKYEG